MCVEQTAVMIELAAWKFPRSLLFPDFARGEKIITLPGNNRALESAWLAFVLACG